MYQILNSTFLQESKKKKNCTSHIFLYKQGWVYTTEP